MIRRCDNCQFYTPSMEGAGECRRFPPSWMGGSYGGARQPVTLPGSICGEHRFENGVALEQS